MLRRFAEQAQDCGAVVFLALGGQQLAYGPVQVRWVAFNVQVAGQCLRLAALASFPRVPAKHAQ